ncbi:MAG: hypothetical protein AAF726_16080 [Planctomycetota bacterium]
MHPHGSDDAPEGGSEPRRRGRRGRAFLMLALVVPAIPLAVPAIVPGFGNAARMAPAPGATLEGVWRRFGSVYDVRTASLDDLWAWLERGGVRDPVSPDDPSQHLWVERGAGVVRLGLSSRGGESEERWRLEVGRARWTGLDATLAASDLDCVLCHASIESGSEARVVSRRPFEPGLGADVRLDGAFVVEPDGQAVPDLLRALERAPRTPGVVEAEHGAVGAIERLQQVGDGRALALSSVRLSGNEQGPVVLRGTHDAPIRVKGDVVVEGDLVLSGHVVGDGCLWVIGNVHVPGDVHHEGAGSLRLLVRGNVLVGEVGRPRRGEALSVTGAPDGSFSFLVEALARFNGALAIDDPTQPPFTVLPGQVAAVLPRGARSTDGWRDRDLELVDYGRTRAVGPLPSAIEGAPMSAAADLPLGRADAGTRLDAVVVVHGAFVAVASGIDTWRDAGAAVGLSDDAGVAVPPASFLLRGALVATHAAIHAPAGVRIVDRPDARAAVRLPADSGLAARLVGPSSSVELGGGPPGEGGVPIVPSLWVDEVPGRDRLLRAERPAPATPR